MDIKRLDKIIIDIIHTKQSKIMMNKLKEFKQNHENHKNINKLLKTSNSAIRN